MVETEIWIFFILYFKKLADTLPLNFKIHRDNFLTIL